MNKLIPHDAILVVCIEDKSYFWCSGDTYEQISDWFQTSELTFMMEQHKCCSYAVWQDFQMRKCFCSGRGD